MDHSPYQSLSRENREIRLFDLLPGKDGDPITGRLKVISLDRKPKFDAVSYVWGPKDPQTAISLGGDHSLPIGPNLHLALSDLRRRWRPLTLWVDALCINQQDDVEKSHQVPMMSSIYRAARMTRAWIDHEVDPKSPALRALPWLVEKHFSPEEAAPKAIPSRSNAIKGHLRMRQEVESHDWEFWKPVTDILKNEYWSRLWIQQELLVPRDVQFHIRKTQIAGRHLFRLRDNLLMSFYYGEYTSGADHPGRWIKRGYTTYFSRNDSEVKRIRHYESDTPLIYLVHESEEYKASNPRDMVYGCLALANPSEVSTLRVDYTLPLSQVYADVVRNHLIHCKRLDFMLFACFKPGGDYPTWLPTAERTFFFQVTMVFEHLDLDWIGVPGSVSDDGRRLEVQAFRLDTVTHASRKGLAGPALVKESLQGIRDCYLSLHPGATEGDIWSSKHLLGILKWVLPHGQGGFPLEALDGAIGELLDLTKNDQYAELNWDAALALLASRPSASEVLVRALGNLRLQMDWQLPVATCDGRLGLVGCTNPEVSPRPTDQIWLLAGCSQSVVLREQELNPGQFILIGTVFFAEFMDMYNTEVWKWFQRRVLAGDTLEDFTQRIVLV
ncbi:heterokaryon incompatibility protein-domain-containing protein [Apiospora marii]|uniref:heterokaryon incompatibility protein-domain-containing protein n=1 Tax=Apiospora marii TaxID=335849 RepID=UPI00312D5D34